PGRERVLDADAVHLGDLLGGEAVSPRQAPEGVALLHLVPAAGRLLPGRERVGRGLLVGAPATRRDHADRQQRRREQGGEEPERRARHAWPSLLSARMRPNTTMKPSTKKPKTPSTLASKASGRRLI